MAPLSWREVGQAIGLEHGDIASAAVIEHKTSLGGLGYQLIGDGGTQNNLTEYLIGPAANAGVDIGAHEWGEYLRVRALGGQEGMEAESTALGRDDGQFGRNFVNEFLFFLGFAGLVKDKGGLIGSEHHAAQVLGGLSVVLFDVGAASGPEQLLTPFQLGAEFLQRLYQAVQAVGHVAMVGPPRAEVHGPLEVGHVYLHAVLNALEQQHLQNGAG